jgi:Winged helix-turn helix
VIPNPGVHYANTKELERRYKKARDPVERSHPQIVWLLSEGRITREVCQLTGYSPGWVCKIARRYNELGLEGLGDRRHQNPGGRGALLEEAAQQEHLRGDRRGRRGAGATLCRTARSARSHKKSHQLPLLAQGGASGMRFRASFTRIRYELLSNTTFFTGGDARRFSKCLGGNLCCDQSSWLAA